MPLEIIKSIDYHDAAKLLPKKKKERIGPKKLTESEFKKYLQDMQEPVKAQKRLAVQVKTFLDFRIDEEMRTKGFLSDHTRRWVESYNNILEKIQKAIYGDKSVSINLHKVTHSQIAARIRGAKTSKKELIEIEEDD